MILTRIVDRSGCGGGGGGSGSAAGGGGRTGSGMFGTDGGVAAQAASCAASSNTSGFVKSVTEPDTHDVDFGFPEPTSSHVQLVKIVNGADINTKVIPIIDLCALHP